MRPWTSSVIIVDPSSGALILMTNGKSGSAPAEASLQGLRKAAGLLFFIANFLKSSISVSDKKHLYALPSSKSLLAISI